MVYYYNNNYGVVVVGDGVDGVNVVGEIVVLGGGGGGEGEGECDEEDGFQLRYKMRAIPPNSTNTIAASIHLLVATRRAILVTIRLPSSTLSST